MGNTSIIMGWEGGHHLKYGREGANKGKSLCLPIKRKRMKSSNQNYKR